MNPRIRIGKCILNFIAKMMNNLKSADGLTDVLDFSWKMQYRSWRILHYQWFSQNIKWDNIGCHALSN